MTDSPGSDGAQTARLFEHRAGHYLSAVAMLLLDEGVPVTSVQLGQPYAQEDVPGGYHLVGYQGFVTFGTELSASLSKVSDAWLMWDDQSGWCVFRMTGDPGEPEQLRWLGLGLVPAPERVAAFLAGARTDFDTAGSEGQPFYRQEGDSYEDVLERMAGYMPLHPSYPRWTRCDWEGKFAADRQAVYGRRVADVLLTQDPDPVLSIPLRRSEVRALALYLECLEPLVGPGRGRMAAALQMDLTRRVPGDPVSADTERRVIEAARRLVQP